jgi:citrate lyase gamma subunit
VEIKNATECYIYIFGQETDGSSYVLFPYLKSGETVSRHSPYCGITGYRLFPKGQSLETDSLGNKDYIAFVVSREELDYRELNQLISRQTGSSYQQRVNTALDQLVIRSVRYNSTREGALNFRADANTNKAVALVVGLNK